MAILALPPSAAFSKGEVLKRITSGGEEKFAVATDGTRAGVELLVGIALETVTAASARPADCAMPGHEIVEGKAGAAIAATDFYLSCNASGRLVALPTGLGSDQVVALNVEGNTAAADGDPINVLPWHLG